jgi:very-short-patch-repair endonuclease
VARILGKAEGACIELFRRVLGGTEVNRRYTFDFLRGDPTPRQPRGAKLPVDAFFPSFSLVVEYMGPQHDESNVLMDRRPGRRQQRTRYQERRTVVLAEHGIRLVRVRHCDELTEEFVRRKLLNLGIKAAIDEVAPGE